ncbi:MAG TPA: DNA-packaging protein [Alcaligenes faecalis]|nr:terminase small subunit [Alcaligenes faecalis]HJE62537.1 DNA-packaging protein [Alcaligenes faecalis]
MTTRNKGGRPTKLTLKTIKAAEEYIAGFEPFDPDDKRLPKREDLALHLGIGRTTLYEWTRDENTPARFLNVLDRLDMMQASRLIDRGLDGTYNATITRMLLGKVGYEEKSIVDHRSGDGTMTPKDPPAPLIIELVAQPFPEDHGKDE